MARWRRRQKVLIPQNVNGVSEARLGYFVKKFGLSLAGLINPPEAEQSQRKKRRVSVLGLSINTSWIGNFLILLQLGKFLANYFRNISQPKRFSVRKTGFNSCQLSIRLQCVIGFFTMSTVSRHKD